MTCWTGYGSRSICASSALGHLGFHIGKGATLFGVKVKGDGRSVFCPISRDSFIAAGSSLTEEYLV